MYVTACKYHLQSLNPLVVVIYPQSISFFFSQYHFIHYIIHYHKKNYGRQNASLDPYGIYCYGQIICLHAQLDCICLIQFLKKIRYVSWYSKSIRYFPHFIPIYGIKPFSKSTNIRYRFVR
jgi:hypothetical protein